MKKNKRLFSPLVITGVISAIIVISSIFMLVHRDDNPSGVGDSLYPGLGNPGYDVLHYQIELNVTPLINHIVAKTLITAQAEKDLKVFNLDLLGLESINCEYWYNYGNEFKPTIAKRGFYRWV